MYDFESTLILYGFALFFYGFALYVTIFSGRGVLSRQPGVPWEENKDSHSIMWVSMREHYTLLSILFYKKDILDLRRLRVPLWSIILKSNFYLNFILIIIAYIMTSSFLISIFLVGGYILSSDFVCFFILQAVDYLICKFNGQQDNYIENLFSPKIIITYIVVQILACFVFKIYMLL